MSRKDPFGESYQPKAKVNPFGDSDESGSVEESAARMEAAARKIRLLKSQIGAEGLTLQAYRDLMDEVSVAIEMCARAVRDIAAGRR